MSHINDKMICKNIVCNARVGCEQPERDHAQRIVIDFEVEVDPIEAARRDEVSAIKIDYYTAYQIVKKTVEAKEYRLIETIAEEIASILLKEFLIKSVLISVSKWPAVIPQETTVTYTCYRSQAA